MPLDIRRFPCLSDNYGFILRDLTSGRTACVDTPDAKAVLGALDEAGWGLDFILNTHWHADHAGGNAEVKATTGAVIVGPAEVTKMAPLDRAVVGGDEVMVGDTLFEVIESGGHTLGHIAYFDPAGPNAFVGDTLFALGCGRMFEGDAPQMWSSLQRLAALPDTTQVYCAHEYTESNARFALSVDPSPELRERAEAVFAARRRGEPTVPTSIGLEKATNPFLRAPLLVGGGKPDHEAFGQIRAAKDTFKG